MKNQLSIKTKLTHFVSANNGNVQIQKVVETFSDYNATNVIGNLKSLAKKGIIAVAAKEKGTREAIISLTEKGEQLIAKKMFFVETV
jgi:DNA-binding MarR family transcriptional regulator